MTPQSDEDEVWRQIVASFNQPAEHGPDGQPWPDSENLPAEPARRVVRRPDDDAAHSPGDTADDTEQRLDTPAGARAPDRDGAFDHDDALADDTAFAERDTPDDDPEDEHYVPPPPPPLPQTDASTKVAWMALFGGPAYLLLTAMFGWSMPGWALFAAVAAFIGGFVALVVRMGDGPPSDSGWDDGAVV